MNETETFVTAGGAQVRYARHNMGLAVVRVAIDGFWFTKGAWAELTAALFPPPPSRYTVDLDVWLP